MINLFQSFLHLFSETAHSRSPLPVPLPSSLGGRRRGMGRLSAPEAAKVQQPGLLLPTPKAGAPLGLLLSHPVFSAECPFISLSVPQPWSAGLPHLTNHRPSSWQLPLAAHGHAPPCSLSSPQCHTRPLGHTQSQGHTILRSLARPHAQAHSCPRTVTDMITYVLSHTHTHGVELCAHALTVTHLLTIQPPGDTASHTR